MRYDALWLPTTVIITPASHAWVNRMASTRWRAFATPLDFIYNFWRLLCLPLSPRYCTTLREGPGSISGKWSRAETQWWRQRDQITNTTWSRLRGPSWRTFWRRLDSLTPHLYVSDLKTNPDKQISRLLEYCHLTCIIAARLTLLSNF